jgi:methionine aminopeptidase
LSIESTEDVAGMEKAGKVTRAVLEAMKGAVRVGISTRELDEVGASTMRSLGGRSALSFLANE